MYMAQSKCAVTPKTKCAYNVHYCHSSNSILYIKAEVVRHSIHMMFPSVTNLQKLLRWQNDNSDNVPLLPVNSRSSTAKSESTALECPTAVQQCTRGQFNVDLFTTELITPLHDTTATNRHAYHHR